MGSRGASSSRGGNSASPAEEIGKKIRSLQDEINTLGDKMLNLAEYAMPSYQGADKETKTRQYYAIMKKRNALRDKRFKLIARQGELAKSRMDSPRKTFVNSYGEATKRGITTSSYERQRKKLASQMMSFVGGDGGIDLPF